MPANFVWDLHYATKSMNTENPQGVASSHACAFKATVVTLWLCKTTYVWNDMSSNTTQQRAQQGATSKALKYANLKIFKLQSQLLFIFIDNLIREDININ